LHVARRSASAGHGRYSKRCHLLIVHLFRYLTSEVRSDARDGVLMKSRHAAALALVGASSIAFVFVFAEHTRGVKAPQPIPTSSTGATWCRDVPASPPPPDSELRPGNWAYVMKACSSGNPLNFRTCNFICMDARARWARWKRKKSSRTSPAN